MAKNNHIKVKNVYGSLSDEVNGNRSDVIINMSGKRKTISPRKIKPLTSGSNGSKKPTGKSNC